MANYPTATMNQSDAVNYFNKYNRKADGRKSTINVEAGPDKKQLHHTLKGDDRNQYLKTEILQIISE